METKIKMKKRVHKPNIKNRLLIVYNKHCNFATHVKKVKGRKQSGTNVSMRCTNYDRAQYIVRIRFQSDLMKDYIQLGDKYKIKANIAEATFFDNKGKKTNIVKQGKFIFN